MKILLVNYRYYVSGGPERYMFNVKAGLEAAGHEVVPFSINYSQNEPTPYAKYFVEPLAGPDEPYYRDHHRTPNTLVRTLSRSVYAPSVERAIVRLIDEVKPDVAYVLHYLRKLSPAVLTGIKKRKLPLFVRLSDYQMVCPQGAMLRNGQPCSLCVTGKLWPSVRYGCVAGSRGASLVNYFSVKYHRYSDFYNLVDQFIVPSRFLYDRMVEGGWPPEKLVHVPTMVSPSFFAMADKDSTPSAAQPYILYVGHVEKHKGLDVLIKAYARLLANRNKQWPRLCVVGQRDGPFAQHCQALLEELGISDQVDIRGFEDRETLAALYRDARMTMVPSIWYENLPNTILESFALGTGVMASRLGSMVEMVTDGVNGVLAEPGSVDDWADKLEVVGDEKACQEMGRAAREEAFKRYQEKQHLDTLVSLFESRGGAGERGDL